MTKPRLRLLGVKVTWKRVADKDELAMHGLRERDSIIRSALETAGSAAAAKRRADLASEEKSMVVVLVVRCVEVQGERDGAQSVKSEQRLKAASVDVVEGKSVERKSQVVELWKQRMVMSLFRWLDWESWHQTGGLGSAGDGGK